jgi:hypothetical protein
MLETKSHPYITTGKIIVLYILIYMFLDSRREDKRLCFISLTVFKEFAELFYWALNKVWIKVNQTDKNEIRETLLIQISRSNSCL